MKAKRLVIVGSSRVKTRPGSSLDSEPPGVARATTVGAHTMKFAVFTDLSTAVERSGSPSDLEPIESGGGGRLASAATPAGTATYVYTPDEGRIVSVVNGTPRHTVRGSRC